MPGEVSVRRASFGRVVCPEFALRKPRFLYQPLPPLLCAPRHTRRHLPASRLPRLASHDGWWWSAAARGTAMSPRDAPPACARVSARSTWLAITITERCA